MREYLRRDRNEWVRLNIGFYGRKVFFLSDLHHRHNNVLKYCGRTEFMNSYEYDEYCRLKEMGDTRMKSLRISRASVERMDNALIDNINAVVGKDDVIWNLGDVYLGRSLPELIELRRRVNCRNIYLCVGNHDKLIRSLHAPFAGHSTRTPKNVLELVDIIQKLCDGKYNTNDAKYLLSRVASKNPLEGVFEGIFDHVLINVDGQEVFASHYCNAVWPKSHHGCFHLYAHSHGSLETWRETHMPKARCFDVGVDHRASLNKGYTPWPMSEIVSVMKEKEGQLLDHHAPD